eukprot:gene6520-18816_t
MFTVRSTRAGARRAPSLRGYTQLRTKKTVCITGAGNSSHVFIPYFTNLGYDVTVFADFKDEAERLQKGTPAARAAGGAITMLTLALRTVGGTHVTQNRSFAGVSARGGAGA